LLLVLAIGAAYAVASVVRHAQFRTGFDLAIFDQAIWNLAHLREPASTVKGIDNLFGDHLHPIILTLAPLRAVWPSPSALLVAQAALVAASIVPVYLFAAPRLGRVGAYALAAGYGCFWGLQSGIGFEFHEVAFAPLLIGLAILFFDRRAWTAWWVTLGLLLLVKEDLSVLVCAFGVLALTVGEHRKGAIAIAAGIVWYVLATKAIIPAFADGRSFSYWSYGKFGSGPLSALGHVVTHPWSPVTVALDEQTKRNTIGLLLATFLGLTLLSRLAIVAIPLLAERMLSDNPLFWGTGYHYSMAIAPVLAMGAAAGLAKLGARTDGRRRRAVLTGGGVAILAANLVIAAGLLGGDGALARAVKPASYRNPEWVAPIRNVLAAVPAGASVAAQDALVPHLTQRRTVAEINEQTGPTDFLVANVVELVGSADGAKTFRALADQVTRRIPAMHPVAYDSGWVALERGPGDGSLRTMSAAQARAFAPVLGRWRRAGDDALHGFGVCPLRASPAAAGACLGRVGTNFKAPAEALTAELTRIAPTLPGGCRDLAGRAGTEASSFTAQVLASTRAGAALRAQDYLAVSGRLAADIDARDPAGLAQRFWVLCGARRLPVAQGGIEPS